MAHSRNTRSETSQRKQPALLEAREQKVSSHTQRPDGDWVLHTLMLEGIDTPFQFRRPKGYRSLQGARVNLSYYIETRKLAGENFEVMKVVRIRRA